MSVQPEVHLLESIVKVLLQVVEELKNLTEEVHTTNDLLREITQNQKNSESDEAAEN